MKFYELTTSQDVESLLKYHEGRPIVLDTEASSKDPRTAALIDVQVTGYTPEEVAIFPACLVDVLKDFRLNVVAHWYKYDYKLLHRYGVPVDTWQWTDTIILEHLLDENRSSYKLDDLIQERWGDDYKARFWQRNKSYQEAPRAEQIDYACRDVLYTGRIYKDAIAKFGTFGFPPTSLVAHVHKLSRCLLATEEAGIAVDLAYLQAKGAEVQGKIQTLAPQMREAFAPEIEVMELEAWEKEILRRKTLKGRQGVKRVPFSFESSVQVKELLYERCKLPPQSKYNPKTKKRQISVDDECLSKLGDLHPGISAIRDYREQVKIYGTYIEGTLGNLQGGRIYPSFNVAGTDTGRVAHSAPNMANIPAIGGIRGMYVPEPGMVLLSADYSGQEVCLEANFTKDPNLKKIVAEGLSKHDITAEGLQIDRKKAKTLNFALQYWCTAGKVAKILGVSKAEGERAYQKYWDTYAGCRTLKQETDAVVEQGGTLVTAFGRMRRFARKKRNEFDADYRKAYNFIIQSPGADLTSMAAYLLNGWLKANGLGRVLFTIHDEILLQCPPEFVTLVTKKTREVMVQCGEYINLEIPLKVEISEPMPRWED